MSRQCFVLCRDACSWVGTRGFPARDKVVLFWFFVVTGVLPVSRQCFVLCRDNVTREGPLSQHKILVSQ